MQLKHQADSSPDAFQPTDSLVLEPSLDFPPQENSVKVLSQEADVVPFIPELVPQATHKKRRSFAGVGALTILLVLGIGVFLTLPSLLSCGSKAKQAEARINLGALNRSQQSYYSEFKTFTNSLTDLSIGIKPQSSNYDYSIRTLKTAAFHYAIAREGLPINSYVGAVFHVPTTKTAQKNQLTILGIICEAVRPGSIPPAHPTLVKGVPTCASGTRDISQVKPR